MKLSNIFDADDRAVSPVIGVILMVAITVILAAVIGTFVLGLGSNVGNNAPQATFEYNYNDGGTDGWNGGSADSAESVEITHQGGSAVENSSIDITIDGTSAYTSGDLDVTTPFASSITAGNSTVINESATDAIEANDDVRIIWSASGGDSSIISSSTVPSN